MKFPWVKMSASWFFGVDVFDLDFGFQIHSIEQPIKSNSVGPGNMSHCRTSAFNNHLDYSFIPRFFVCQAPNAFICVSSVAPPKHQMRLYVCHQMRLYVCHQMRLYVCHQMRLYVCHQMRLLMQRSSLRSHVF